MSSEPSSDEVIVTVFGRTDVGRVRDHNEDAFLVVDLSADNASLQPEVRQHHLGARGSLFMVADGLGGAAAGEIASELAINTVYEELRDRWARSGSDDPETFARTLKSAAEIANAKIFAYAVEHPEHRGLGTTATIAGLLGDTLYVVQVGDSRAYLIRDGVARQITKDQSLMQRLVEAGELTQEEADRSERRNIILQALGPEPTVKIDLTFQQVRRGDTLVLCTDGLSGLVPKEEIADIIEQEDDLIAACRELIDRANENGGPDNITVVAARFEGAGLADPHEEDEVGHAVFPLPGSNTPTAPHFAFGDGDTAPLFGQDADSGADDFLVERQVTSGRALLLAVAGGLLLLGLLIAAREWRRAAHAASPPSSAPVVAPTPAASRPAPAPPPPSAPRH